MKAFELVSGKVDKSVMMTANEKDEMLVVK